MLVLQSRRSGFSAKAKAQKRRESALKFSSCTLSSLLLLLLLLLLPHSKVPDSIHSFLLPLHSTPSILLTFPPLLLPFCLLSIRKQLAYSSSIHPKISSSTYYYIRFPDILRLLSRTILFLQSVVPIPQKEEEKGDPPLRSPPSASGTSPFHTPTSRFSPQNGIRKKGKKWKEGERLFSLPPLLPPAFSLCQFLPSDCPSSLRGGQWKRGELIVEKNISGKEGANGQLFSRLIGQLCHVHPPPSLWRMKDTRRRFGGFGEREAIKRDPRCVCPDPLKPTPPSPSVRPPAPQKVVLITHDSASKQVKIGGDLREGANGLFPL